jgi:hypothetical protein
MMFVCFWRTEIAAQNLSLKYTIKYVENKNVYYQITDSSAVLSQMDFVKLRKSNIKDSVITEVYTNNDIKTTIHHKLNTKHEAWMTPVVKTVIDKNRTKVYGTGNTVLVNELHSQKYLQNYTSLKTALIQNGGTIIPTFIQITAPLMQQLIDSGFVYTQLQQGFKKFTKDTIEILFNNTKLVNHVTLYYSNGDIKYSEKRVFKINALQQKVPSYKIEKEWDNRFPDKCIMKTTITDYPDYTITYYNSLKEASDVHQEDQIQDFKNIFMYPNPAAEFLHISYYTNKINAEPIIYEISDVSGLEVLSGEKLLNGDDLTIHIRELKAGVYIIKVKLQEETIMEKFIKN